MRKISLMLVILFCTLFAAQAQTVTDLSQLSNDKVYTLKSARAFLIYSSKVPGKICSNNGSSVGTVSYSTTNENLQFRIEKKGDNYFLFSEGAQKYVGADGNFVDKPSVALNITNVGGSYPWKLMLGSQGMNSQVSGQTSEGIKVDGWTDTDEGNSYQIAEAVAKAKVYSLTVLGAEGATVTYEGQEYLSGATFETNKPIKKSDFTASAIEISCI